MSAEEVKVINDGSTLLVEAIVTIDERGQMVLPKELRERAGIGPGQKLAVVGFEERDQVCCISLFKVDDLAGMVKDRLGPIMQGAFES